MKFTATNLVTKPVEEGQQRHVEKVSAFFLCLNNNHTHQQADQVEGSCSRCSSPLFCSLSSYRRIQEELHLQQHEAVILKLQLLPVVQQELEAADR